MGFLSACYIVFCFEDLKVGRCLFEFLFCKISGLLGILDGLSSSSLSPSGFDDLRMRVYAFELWLRSDK